MREALQVQALKWPHSKGCGPRTRAQSRWAERVPGHESEGGLGPPLPGLGTSSRFLGPRQGLPCVVGAGMVLGKDEATGVQPA